MRSAAEIAPFAPSVAQLLWCIYQCCCWERPVYSITSIMCSQCCVGTQTGDPPPLRVHTALSPPSQTHGDRAHTLLPVSLTVPEHRLGLENQERGILFHFHGGMTWVLLPPSQSQLFFFFFTDTNRKKERKWHFGFSGMAHSQDTLTVPPKPLHDGDHVGLNEDLVRILRENLLQQERPRLPRDRRSMSPRLSPITLSPRNSPRLLRRMLLNNNTHKQRRFTVAHTW